jgi:predicted RNA-binding Zn-ribbon protein involved in translation (DUF1610 family)
MTERLRTTIAEGYASSRCPCCGALIRTLADEAGDHDCPRCGYGPDGPTCERKYTEGDGAE